MQRRELFNLQGIYVEWKKSHLEEGEYVFDASESTGGASAIKNYEWGLEDMGRYMYFRVQSTCLMNYLELKIFRHL